MTGSSRGVDAARPVVRLDRPTHIRRKERRSVERRDDERGAGRVHGATLGVGRRRRACGSTAPAASRATSRALALAHGLVALLRAPSTRRFLSSSRRDGRERGSGPRGRDELGRRRGLVPRRVRVHLLRVRRERDGDGGDASRRRHLVESRLRRGPGLVHLEGRDVRRLMHPGDATLQDLGHRHRLGNRAARSRQHDARRALSLRLGTNAGRRRAESEGVATRAGRNRTRRDSLGDTANAPRGARRRTRRSPASSPRSSPEPPPRPHPPKDAARPPARTYSSRARPSVPRDAPPASIRVSQQSKVIVQQK